MDFLTLYTKEILGFLWTVAVAVFTYLQTRKPKITTAVDVTNNLIKTVNEQLNRASQRLKEVETDIDRHRADIREKRVEIREMWEDNKRLKLRI